MPNPRNPGYSGPESGPFLRPGHEVGKVTSVLTGPMNPPHNTRADFTHKEVGATITATIPEAVESARRLYADLGILDKSSATQSRYGSLDDVVRRQAGVQGGAFPPSSDGTISEGFAPKFDAHKVRVDLLPIQPMNDIAEVFTFGAKKYFANSFRQGETVSWSRTYGSIIRHLFAFWRGEDRDPESGLSHLAHAGTQLMILMEHFANNKDKDDRFIR